MEAFISKTARELQERMSGRATTRERERDFGCWAGVGRVFPNTSLFSRRWTHTLYTHAVHVTYLGPHKGTKGHQHLRVIQKLNQHGLRSSRRETKTTPLRFPANTHQHTHTGPTSTPKHSQIIICVSGRDPAYHTSADTSSPKRVSFVQYNNWDFSITDPLC